MATKTITYQPGKKYQTGNHYTVFVNEEMSDCSISVNHSAGWQLDVHDKRERTFRLMDGGIQRAAVIFRGGSILELARKLHSLNERTTWGELNGMTTEQYADVIRVWIDMKAYVRR